MVSRIKKALVFVGRQRILVARRVSVVHLGATGLEVSDVLLRVLLDELAALPRLFEQLPVHPLSLVQARILPELRPLRHLGSLRVVDAVAEHIAASAIAVMDEGKEPLSGQLGSLLGEAIVLQGEQAVDDLFFAELGHFPRIANPRNRSTRFDASSCQPYRSGKLAWCRGSWSSAAAS